MLLHTTSHRSSFLRRTFHLRPTTSCKCSAKLFTTLKLPLRAPGGCRGDAYVVRAIRFDGRISGVQTSSRCGAVLKGIWNTRAWSLQEYTAAKVVHFYTGLYSLPRSQIAEPQRLARSLFGDGRSGLDRVQKVLESRRYPPKEVKNLPRSRPR
ncbi:hypothetical protein L210DRAFT_2142277 [Boletus edulis BED1]|uniref:Uncharacterized protein n=1 Tax=Boletus edulis BED1 TaxID=1328754 RepID=A0AAD4G7G3_BOLED|nr:hypothetical protein L210DRAFT_3572526 [Boletus edulis BED1]KAF8423433.1 hypothetical protein L210DRAFT_2141075 [Boletus edulis BED1]KAF8423466.1 hypothetical protein L210DRAFT_2142277 [Boletus edulis BED1]